MARTKFRGDAQAVAQVSQFTVTAAGSAADTIFVTINSKVVTYTVQGGDTVALVVANLVILLAASQIPEFQEVTWTGNATTVFGTATTAGMPFTFTVGVTGGVTQGGITTPTASAGPNHWDTATNWTLGAVPVTGDTVDLEDCSVDILYGLAQSAVTLAAMNIASTYTGAIGNLTNNGTYYEYRKTYLEISITALTIGAGAGSGSGRIRLDLGSVVSTVLILNSGSGGQQGVPAILLKGSNTSNVVTVVSGIAGLATELGTVFASTTVNVGGGGQGGTPATLYIGGGATLVNLNQQGGALYTLPGVSALAVTAFTQDDGEATFSGAANVTALVSRGGKTFYDASGTITTATLVGGTLDFSRDPRAKVVTNCTAYPGSTLLDPAKHASFTNPISVPGGLKSITHDLGEQVSILRS